MIQLFQSFSLKYDRTLWIQTAKILINPKSREQKLFGQEKYMRTDQNNL